MVVARGREPGWLVIGLLLLSSWASVPRRRAAEVRRRRTRRRTPPRSQCRRPRSPPADRDAASEVAGTYAADLAALQATGAKALQPGGDVVGFYRSFDERTRSALAAYGALQVPPEVTAVRDRAVALLQQQADLLREIADHAIEGAGESTGPQLDQLTAVMNDFATTNAELLRRLGVQQAGA